MEDGKDARPVDTVELIREAAEPLPGLDDPRFGGMFDRIADRRIVLLGEASHGTSEFYRARAQITKRLIREHGFTIVAVEADWPDAAHVDRFIRHRPQDGMDEPAFSRFPTWMWRNEEVEGFVGELRRHNEGIPDARDRVGFYGLDLYNLRSSIAAVLNYLDRVDPETARLARERYGCLSPWQRDPDGLWGGGAWSRLQGVREGRGRDASGLAEEPAVVLEAGWRGVAGRSAECPPDRGGGGVLQDAVLRIGQ